MVNRITSDMEDYAPGLLVEVIDHAETDGQVAFLAEAFTDLVLDGLEELGLWPDYQLAFLKRRGLEISAWGIDEINEVLYLAVTDFIPDDNPSTIGRSDRDAVLKRLTNFLTKAVAGSIDVAEHNQVADIIELLRSGDGFHAVQCYLLTNKVSISTDPPDVEIAGRPVSFRTWDLETVRRSRTTGMAPEAIEIDMVETFGRGIPALRSPKEFGDVDTFLLFMPGRYLADIYQSFGPRLLEQNVRSFLMARGKVNRGIRDTLRSEPERFLAYNNGITATASRIETTPEIGGPLEITAIRDFQIVNGAQTTASIALAARDPEVQIDDVSVQVKLTVVSPELVSELVPNISRFANAQNAVSASDLSANDQYLRGLQEASRTEWTPADASVRPTKWYFERARGSYAVERSEAGTPTQQKQFTSVYPRNQKFDKNQLAVYANTWSRRPSDVSRGGQKNFIAYMATVELDPQSSTDESKEYFRRVFRESVSQAILFRTTDSLVRSQLGGTYKRQIVTYTLAYLLEKAPGTADLDLIWRTQAINDSLARAIGQIAQGIKDLLLKTGEGKNITEWTKRPECWELIRDEVIVFDRPPSAESSQGKSAKRSEKVGRSAKRDAGGMTLPLAIEAVFGEQIEGTWRRHRRKKWRHAGDTRIETPTGEGTWHVFTAEFKNDQGPYSLDVAVDFPMREIYAIGQVQPMATRIEISSWIADRRPRGSTT